LDNIKPILLPGTEKQLHDFYEFFTPEGKNILIIGTGTESVAEFLAKKGNNVVLIVEDHENLMQLRFIISHEAVSVRMMDFTNTDFRDEKFDAVYLQAAVLNRNRHKIVKEIKRVLVKDGIFCVGEIVNLEKRIPSFVSDIWEHSGLEPFYIDDLSHYYSDKGFEIVKDANLSATLDDFYARSEMLLKRNKEKLTEEEIIYYKKILKKFKHESNAYLRLGGKAYMGYKMLILRKV
jgi:SAM-dependent methyltransferase